MARVTLQEEVREVDRFGPYLAAGAISLSFKQGSDMVRSV